MGKKRIHILEDDQEIRNVIEILLSDEGFELQLSSSFAELKKNIQDAMPDLFLLDVMLPDGNGAEICEDLKTDIFTKHIPIIVMSAQNNSEQKAIDAFADDYISKPFDIDDVLKRINAQLQKSADNSVKI
ncbi:response regulator transcription factor [Pedobacter sp. HDW13]|uniref:response regulator transcription factor n=1 Tax=unclassified Pedobacter TaxID=2628915 RepID=UPI000F5ADDE6|nr:MULTISPECIES: response regulator transcription factor [unclassified Pedobacter]QIL41798.1 response regulator transcription factor [Pedobacter sp. HDW13]RQO73421.1 response regulator [Pedobacter sp. KBW01]